MGFEVNLFLDLVLLSVKVDAGVRPAWCWVDNSRVRVEIKVSIRVKAGAGVGVRPRGQR